MIDPQSQALATKATTEASAVLTWLREALPEIRTQDQAQQAASMIVQIGEQRKAVDGQRKHIKAPILEAGRRVEALFKPALTAYKAAEDYLKAQVGTFRRREQERQAAMLREASSPAEVAQAVEVLAPTPTGLVERESWRGDVVDESQLPRDFWIVDQAKIDRVIRAAKGQVTIPGVRVVRDVNLVRSGR